MEVFVFLFWIILIIGAYVLDHFEKKKAKEKPKKVEMTFINY